MLVGSFEPGDPGDDGSDEDDDEGHGGDRFVDDGGSEERSEDNDDCGEYPCEDGVESTKSIAGCGDSCDGGPECLWCDGELSPTQKSYECWVDTGDFDEDSDKDKDMYAPCLIKDW